MGRKARAKKTRRANRAAGIEPQILKNAAAPPAGPIDKPVAVSDHDFDRRVTQSDLPVLVDFWAPWCGPCKMIAPALEKLAEQMAGKLVVAKYNTEGNQRVAQAMGIRSIPTLALFKDGEVVDVKIGAIPAAALEAWVTKKIDPKPGLLGSLFGRASG